MRLRLKHHLSYCKTEREREREREREDRNHKKNVVRVRQILDSHWNSRTAKYAVQIASSHTNIPFGEHNISRDRNVSRVRTVMKQEAMHL